MVDSDPSSGNLSGMYQKKVCHKLVSSLLLVNVHALSFILIRQYASITSCTYHLNTVVFSMSEVHKKASKDD
jgi:hypothetical protein